MAEFGEEACGPDSHPSKSLLPLAIASPESENPFRLWEKPHKKRKAQPKSTLVSIYNWGEGISHRFNSHTKKRTNYSEADVFPISYQL